MAIKLTWLGCAAYILDIDGTRLMVDPFFFRQQNPHAKPELKTKKEDIKNIAGIFISHGHIDHITDAGWFAEFQNVPVYCSEVAKENIIRWAKGEILKEEAHELSERAKNNIHIVKWGDIIKFNDSISVEILKSKHILFDANTIFARIKSKDFWKNIKEIKPFTKLGKGLVHSFAIKYDDKKIVSYGSLWDKYEDVLIQNQDCNIFITPLAGASKKHLAKKGGKMVALLKPEVVVPLHWDNFFPPISRFEDLRPFEAYMKKNHPDIKIIMPEMDKEITL